ncbi:MAG: DUF2062 domain-containing protein [Burkholderiaceae bacterium]
MSRKPNWFDKHLPTQEELASHRWLKPWAPRLIHPALWHMTRRSVAKGAAIGIFWAFLVPVLQIFFAAFTAMMTRANVPVAAGATFVTNPLTLAPVLYGEYRVGSWLLGKNGSTPPPLDHDVSWWMSGWHTISHYGLPLVVGIVVFAVVGGALTYFVVELVWRWRSIKRWRNRRKT